MKKADIETFKRVLNVIKTRSTCAKTNVGAVIVRDGRIISTGWNGVPPGHPHCKDVHNGLTIEEITSSHETFKDQEIHAEANAISYAARIGIPTENASIFTSHSPCYSCAQLIVASGIVEVYYQQIYHRVNSILYLESCGVKVFSID